MKVLYLTETLLMGNEFYSLKEILSRNLNLFFIGRRCTLALFCTIISLKLGRPDKEDDFFGKLEAPESS